MKMRSQEGKRRVRLVAQIKQGEGSITCWCVPERREKHLFGIKLLRKTGKEEEMRIAQFPQFCKDSFTMLPHEITPFDRARSRKRNGDVLHTKAFDMR